MTLDKLVAAPDVARHFGVNAVTVYTWARQGRIPCVRPSSHVVRFRISDVEQAMRIEHPERMDPPTEIEKSILTITLRIAQLATALTALETRLNEIRP